jgi:hypothetical protein
MADTDLLRRLDAALAMTHLPPEYARNLLRECRDTLQPRPLIEVRADLGVPPDELWFVQNGQIVGRITGVSWP